MEEFVLSLGLIFVAELGDKTQLVALTLATRFRAGVVLAGIFVATLLVHLVSVAIGGLTGTFLSGGWIELLSGLAFTGFGLSAVRSISPLTRDPSPAVAKRARTGIRALTDPEFRIPRSWIKTLGG